jgi:ribosomal protein S18 acetylase RimI-like enzyme
MTLPITTHPALPEDYDFVRTIYFETRRWVIEQQFGWDEALESEKFRRLYKIEETRVVFVNDQPVGWVQMRDTPKAIEMTEIFITTAFQDRGIGTQLITAALNRARAEGKIVLLSTAKVDPAKKLLKSLGFYMTHEDGDRIHLRHDCAS